MENPTPRLLVAAKVLNISKKQLVDYLRYKGFAVREHKPNEKLTVEMYSLLKRKFFLDTSLLLVANKYGVSKSRLLEFLSGKGFDIHNNDGSMIENLSKDMVDYIENEFSTQLETTGIHIKPERIVATIVSPKPKEVLVEWKDVKFEDYEVRFKYDGNFSSPYTLPDSRKSYKYIQNYIVGLNFEPLKVTVKGNKVIQVENINYLKEVVRIIKIRHEYKEGFDVNLRVSATKVMDIIRGVSRETILHIIKGREVDESIDFLCEHQNQEDKIIPVLEINRSGNNTVEQDAFIFTIRNEKDIFLIWESTRKGKATYIFKTNEEQLMMQLQSIFDYISSSLSLKRTKLRQGSIEANELNYLCYVTHATFEGWKSKLLRTIFN